MPELCMNFPSCIGQDHKIIPKLYRNAPNWIRQSHKVMPKLSMYGYF